MKDYLVALSGGIDSALVLALAYLAKSGEQKIEAVYMPGLYSSTLSYELSKKMCETLGIKLKSFPIKFLHSTIKREYKSNLGSELENLADENIQSRLRGALIYARANDTGAMVINTSNKSELSVGYSTMYGDSVGALSIIGDLYKSEVYELAKYINEKYGNLIPEQIISRPPSAGLREDQKDSDSLPPYEILDPILESLTGFHQNCQDLLANCFSLGDIEKVTKLYTRAEFKRKQFCPILKLKNKSFGFGHRIPISKSIDYYTQNK